MTRIEGIRAKKKYGQHFLRNKDVILKMINNVNLSPQSNIFEIGCGDGFLTEIILKNNPNKLWVFEIDPEWAVFVRNKLQNPKMTIFEENILETNFSVFEKDKPWIILANLPYQITFPILHLLQKNAHILQEGVIMIQEEVAQKITKTRGKGYGYNSLFFQHYFIVKLLTKVPPSDFIPAPKVFSRLLYLKPKKNIKTIKNEEGFWKFIKVCFRQPRRTLRNNLIQSNYDLNKIPPETFDLRSQQLVMEDFLNLWSILNK